MTGVLCTLSCFAMFSLTCYKNRTVVGGGTGGGALGLVAAVGPTPGGRRESVSSLNYCRP